MTFGTVLRQSNMAFCSLKYTYVGKKIRGKPERIWILAKLRICDLRTGIPRKFVDLRINHYKFADWHTSEICGFAITK